MESFINAITLNIEGDWLHHKWAALIVLAALFFPWETRTFRASPFLCLFFSYAILTTINPICYSSYGRIYAGDAAISLSMLLVFLYLCGSDIEFLFKLLRPLAIVSVAIWIISAFCGYKIMGFGGVSSQNSLFMSLLSMLIMSNRRLDRTIFYAMSGCVVLTGGSMGILSLFAGVCAYVLSTRRNLGTLGIVFALSIALIAVAVATRSEFANTSGRVVAWKIMYDWMNTSGTWIFGNGLGSFSYIVPKIQQMVGGHTALFYHAHSDILQGVFELGIAGFGIFVLAAYDVVKKTWDRRDHWLLAFWSSLLVGMCGYMPAHMPPESMLIVMAIMRISYEASDDRSAA